MVVPRSITKTVSSTSTSRGQSQLACSNQPGLHWKNPTYAPPSASFLYLYCPRVCASRIGLLSHTHLHQRKTAQKATLSLSMVNQRRIDKPHYNLQKIYWSLQSHFKRSQKESARKICLGTSCLLLFLYASHVLNFKMLHLIPTELSGEASLCFITFD